LQRINRKLSPKEKIVKARGGAAVQQCGEFYKVDMRRNIVCEAKVSLEDTARKLKVLEPWESLNRGMLTIV
jgi:hypothetical protein